MLGDYVQTHSGLSKVTGITENGVHFIDKFGGGIASGVEPIPLTVEFLEKNFTVNKPYQEKYGTKSLIHYALPSPIYPSVVWNLVWVIGEDGNYLVIEDDPLIRMKYVHQLQHVLKLCNIQKEIQL